MNKSKNLRLELTKNCSHLAWPATPQIWNNYQMDDKPTGLPPYGPEAAHRTRHAPDIRVEQQMDGYRPANSAQVHL